MTPIRNIQRIVTAFIAFLLIAAANAFAQSVSVDGTAQIQGALGQYNGGYYLAGGIGTITATYVDSAGQPHGTNTTGIVGTDFTIPGIGSVPAHVSWSTTASPDGYLVIHYESKFGWLTKSGDIKTSASITGLPGYVAPASGPSSTSQSTNQDSAGVAVDFNDWVDSTTANFAANYYASQYSSPIAEGTVTLGDCYVVYNNSGE
jgi:hypothetical protein